MFQKLSFKSRLLILSSFLCSISVIVGIVGYFALSGVSEQYKAMTQTSVPKMGLAYQMFLEFRDLRINVRGLDSKTASIEVQEQTMKKIKANISNYDELNKKYLDIGVVPKQKPFHDNVETVWLDYKKDAERVAETFSSTDTQDVKWQHDFYTTSAPKKSKA